MDKIFNQNTHIKIVTLGTYYSIVLNKINFLEINTNYLKERNYTVGDNLVIQKYDGLIRNAISVQITDIQQATNPNNSIITFSKNDKG